MSRPRGKGPKRREQEVLEAAVRVFHARGYAGASIQDLADELGILKGSVYHYIRSKEDLLFRLLSETHEDVEALLAEVQAIEGIGPLERLYEYIRRQVEYTAANLATIAIYYHDVSQLPPERRREIYDRRRAQEQFVADLIADAQERGEARADDDPVTLTRYAFGSMIWVYTWWERWKSSGADPRHVAAACAEQVVRGVIGRPRGTSASSAQPV